MHDDWFTLANVADCEVSLRRFTCASARATMNLSSGAISTFLSGVSKDPWVGLGSHSLRVAR
jgi:hypothetical protein